MVLRHCLFSFHCHWDGSNLFKLFQNLLVNSVIQELILHVLDDIVHHTLVQGDLWVGVQSVSHLVSPVAVQTIHSRNFETAHYTNHCL